MSNLMDIQNQIGKLQKQADEIKSKEFDNTVQEILAKMRAFGITPKDLLPNKRRGPKLKGKSATATNRGGTAKKATNPVLPKFRGPDGQTWSGRGLMPRWLSALVAQGQAKEDFAVKD